MLCRHYNVEEEKDMVMITVCYVRKRIIVV